MKNWMFWMIGLMALTGSACNLLDLGCTSDLQCREGRVCEATACQWANDIPPTEGPGGMNSDTGEEGVDTNRTPGPDDVVCNTDEECDVNSLCRDGICDAFRCANEDGTDVSEACECNKFVYADLEGGGCEHEMQCFSGNLTIECLPITEDDLYVCTCMERLEPTMEFILEGELACEITRGAREELSAMCGWEWP